MRKTIIAGNWKMNCDVAESKELAKAIVETVKGVKDVEVVICPAYTNLYAVSEVVSGTNVALGAQDLHWEDKGAFTGKISAGMLLSAGVKYVIIGHSEQRTYFGETNETVNKKVKKALEKGLLPIICVGEKLEERETNVTEKVVETQIRAAFAGISNQDALRCVVAYEPVWAIGTGKTATPEQAQEVHAFIRKLLVSLYGKETASALRIQYGGSMNDKNAGELLKKEDIDGGLIGGAALKAESFFGIIKPI